jgi:hypothetical protein
VSAGGVVLAKGRVDDLLDFVHDEDCVEGLGLSVRIGKCKRVERVESVED